MANLNILICGGGIAGPSLAFWLAKAGHTVTIVERHPVLRSSGAQIDLRAQGIEVVKRMGIMHAIRKNLVDEKGRQIVDGKGNIRATIMANTSGKGAQSVTSEYEIMRGDLVRILYDATKDKVRYIFGKTVETFEQDEEKVTVHFSDNTSSTFDILVGADGQGSRIRKAISHSDSDDLRHLGMHAAYYIIPRETGDTNFGTVHISTRRWIMFRTHNDTEAQVYFFMRDDGEEIRKIHKAPVEEQKTFWANAYKDVEWQTDRFIKAMNVTDNFYSQEIVQVRSSSWSQGRVVLLGDAAHCPSPMTGMGTTGAFVGAYVLAGEICRNADLSQAFENYESTMRPFVDEMQKLPLWLLRLFYPDSALGVFLVYLVVSVVSFLRIPALVARFSREDKGGWQLPEYSALETKVHVQEKS